MELSQHGWFISWKILLKWMMNGDTSISGNTQNEWWKHSFFGTSINVMDIYCDVFFKHYWVSCKWWGWASIVRLPLNPTQVKEYPLLPLLFAEVCFHGFPCCSMFFHIFPTGLKEVDRAPRCNWICCGITNYLFLVVQKTQEKPSSHLVVPSCFFLSSGGFLKWGYP